MSRVRRLSIRGLRNFGSETEEASFRFSRPLTLILGPNGTGKTTIIEALKFATTGEFPPDSEKGRAFIHDPVFSTTNTVRCSVKAEIIDSIGDSYVISRTVESGKHQTKPYIKTLDNCITRKKKGSSQPVSVTNRCVDTDMEIALAMGVSKPILKYVIFCHQEELSWPFESAKVLKEKFDEIFDSTKFNKAIESIGKYSRELQADIRILASEVRSCEIIVGEVKTREDKVKFQRDRLREYENAISEVNEGLEPLSSRMEQYAEQIQTHNKLCTEEEKKALEYKLVTQQARALRDNIVNIYSGTIRELQEEIDSYDNMMMIRSTEITECEANLHDTNKQETKLRNTLAEEKTNLGTYRQQIKHHEEKVKCRDQILNEALSSWNLGAADSNITEMELRALTLKLDEKLKETEARIASNRKAREKEEEKMQKEVDVSRNKHSKLESERDIKKRELSDIQKENADIKSQIRQIGMTATKLDSIESKKQEAQNKLQELSKSLDVDAVRQEIQNSTKLRNDLESKINTIDTEIMNLHKQSALKNEEEFNKSALEKVESEMAKIEARQKDNIKMLIDVKEVPKRKLKMDIDRSQQELTKQVNAILQEIQAEESNLTALETTMSFNKKELLKKEKELKADKERISSVCNYKEYDEALLLQATKVKDLQDKRGMYAHQGAAYKEYMKQLKETDPCCPLCHRDFSKREEVQKLLREMEGEMESHPNRLKKCEVELRVQQEQYDKMLQLKPVVEKVIQMEQEELEHLRDLIENTSKKVLHRRLSISELQTKKTIPEQKLTKVKETMGDIIMWDRCIDERSKLVDKIGDIKVRLTEAGIVSERTIDKAQIEREALKESLQTTRSKIEDLQLELNIHNEELQDARGIYNALHEEQLKIQADMQKLKQLRDQQEALHSKEIGLRELITKLQEKELQAAKELQSKIRSLELTKKENKQDNESDNMSITDHRRRVSEFKNAQAQVDSFVSRKIYEALAQSEAKIQKYEGMIKEHVKMKTDIDRRVNQLKEERSRQEVRKMELADNMQLRTAEQTAESLRQQRLALREKMSAVNINKIDEEMTRLQELKNELLQKKNKAIGKREEVERTMKQFADELQKDMYRNARKNHKKKMIELTVQEETIQDLKVCSKILDSAMMSYHEQRMSMINKIIKQLWKHVYTGSDTTSIEIRTEPTEGIGSARRTYNYKLVQTKHGREMDMRGRCSAGQKVLASIIIRLALAETFCKECGILALDEPTTNLDEDNANSLASALASVVKLRAQYQKNFQLIVISHDERFLFRLADLNNKKEFYELFRKPSGLTGVRHCQVGSHEEYSLNVVKEEPSSDEEAEAPSVRSGTRDQRSHATSISSTSSGDTSRKRTTWDKESDDQEEPRPQKKRYVFKH